MLYPPTPFPSSPPVDGTGFLLSLELDELPPTTPDVPLLELLLDDELLPVELLQRKSASIIPLCYGCPCCLSCFFHLS